MSNINALPQESTTIDGMDFLMTAMTATDALVWQEAQLQKAVDAGEGKSAKVDLTDVKKYVCKYISYEGKVIDEKTFNVIFARKSKTLHKLYEAFLDFNFPKDESDSED